MAAAWLFRAARRGSAAYAKRYSVFPLPVEPWTSELSGPASSTVLSGYTLAARNFSAEKEKLFNKVLVANRGEIACRVMKTARLLGIKTVAIYSEPDADSPHVQMADEAVCVGPAASSKSYLNMDAVMDAVKATRADCVHPGYGFLSENANFVKLLEAEGVTFVGPSASAIAAMGDKIESKILARAAGVSTVPGREDVIRDAEHAVEIAQEVGFPVMLKASGGGGGKGMRVAWNEEEVRQQFDVCRQEVISSFADDRIFVERYIDRPRHIEIQVMGDKHGNVVWLPERECSIQRRNQKVIEESPSTFLDPATRKAMGEQAVALATAVKYDTAGTVEFLVDPNRNFFFLEMNTRLQVEHPVTECVTGLDLVELMFRSAAGKPLPINQDRARQIKGWALEARVYCEHAGMGFLPSTGKLRRYRPPKEVRDADRIIRLDAGVEEGQEVTMHYDPLLAKLTTWGHTRDSAIATMNEALDKYYVDGLFNNVSFLRCIFSHPAFVSGDINTKFLEFHYPKGFTDDRLSDREKTELLAIAGFLHTIKHWRSYIAATIASSPSNMNPNAHRTGEDDSRHVHLVISMDGNHTEMSARLRPAKSSPELLSAEIHVGREVLQVEEVLRKPISEGSGPITVLLDGKEAICMIQQRLPRGFKLRYSGCEKEEVLVHRADIAALQKFMPAKKGREFQKALRAPMPGSIVDVAVEAGHKVIVGDELLTVEAMKMRNVLRATQAAVVKKVRVEVGANVALDDILVEFE